MKNDRKWSTWLFNPFVYIAGWEALGYGLGAIALAAVVGSLGRTHFDGVLDTHMGRAAPLWVFLVEGLVDWLSLGLTLLVAGRIVSRTSFRSIDVLGTQALARWPTLLISLVTLPKAVQRYNEQLVQQVTSPNGLKLEFTSPDAIAFFVAITAMLPLICWLVVLMYKAFSLACNVKGAKAIITFLLGVLVAEVVSKVVIIKAVL